MLANHKLKLRNIFTIVILRKKIFELVHTLKQVILRKGVRKIVFSQYVCTLLKIFCIG